VLKCFAESGSLYLNFNSVKEDNNTLRLFSFSLLYLVFKPCGTRKIFLCILELNSSEALSYLTACRR